MNSNIMYGIIYLVVFAFSYYFWKKSKDRDWLWFSWIGIVATAIDVLHYFLKNVVAISSVATIISDFLFIAFDIVIVIFLLKILFKKKSN